MYSRETIFKRTSTGKVQTWQGELDGNKYRTISGQQDGKKVTSAWTECFGKNTGKSNETSDELQAALELDALYRKKLDREYRLSLDDIDTKHYTKPMKAISWKDDAKKRPKPGARIAVQPKLDGMRNLASVNGCKSREGKIIPGAPHINEALQELFAAVPGIELDGELYNHDYKEDFEGLMSAMKKAPSDAKQAAHARNVVQYHVYDLVDTKTDFESRFIALQAIFNTFLAKHGDMFHLVETDFAEMDEDAAVVDAINEKHLDEGYEGSIVRVAAAPYETKRSNNLFKVKNFFDGEFPIVDIVEGKGNWAGYAKSVAVLLPNGNVCNAGVKGDQAAGKKLLEERESLIGK